jgi:hypothetical protein
MMRRGPFPHVLPIPWISRPVMICHKQCNNAFRSENTTAGIDRAVAASPVFSSSDNLIGKTSAMTKACCFYQLSHNQTTGGLAYRKNRKIPMPDVKHMGCQSELP